MQSYSPESFARSRPTYSLPGFDGETLTQDALDFFFIFCPNNSGKIVMSQYLAAQIGGYLPPFGNNEGQSVPGVREIMRVNPWDETQLYDWPAIRQHWQRLAKGRVFVEASPPNLLRAEAIRSVFGADSSALLSVCDPVQHVSSCVSRYGGGPAVFRNVTRKWLWKAGKILDIQSRHPQFPLIRYEDFVRNPQVLNDRLGLALRDYDVAGKDGSGLTGIQSGYARAVAFLRPEEIETIAAVLRDGAEVVQALGYGFPHGGILEQIAEREPGEFDIGQARRAAWEARRSSAGDRKKKHLR